MSLLEDVLEVITPAWLTDVLKQRGWLPSGQVREIVSQAPLPGRSLIIPLRIAYSVASTSAPERLILKIPQAAAAGNLREMEFYATFARDELPLIRCLDVTFQPFTQRFFILLEDLSTTHRAHPPSFLPPTIADSERIVKSLAHIHAYWWNHSELWERGLRPTEPKLQRQHQENVALFAQFADFLGDRLSAPRRQIYEKVLTHGLPLFTRRMTTGQPLTLIHADLHAGNMLYPRHPAKETLRLIDWKSWGIYPGAFDMTNMLVCYWIRERRQQLQDTLLRRYHHYLLEFGVTNYDWEACWYDYRLGIIEHLFFPVWQQSVDTPDFAWWHNFDRILTAYDDLNCGELL
jgi:hypothetical protein